VLERGMERLLQSMSRPAVRVGGIVGLLGIGLALAAWQPISLSELLAWGRAMSEMPLLIGLVLLGMALLFAFGLPGTLGMWLIAPFQPPLISTVLLVSASLTGALGAYALARRMRGDWRPDGVGGKVFNLLERRSDLMTQTALRVLPGFPHSVVNFAGGLLLLPLAVFTISALIGMTIKWAVYASAVYGVVDAVESDSAIQLNSLLPLLILSILLLVGTWVKSRMKSEQT
jgi:uncharacterized membrane protein YdjX (TVP38/TMEM64 family)